MKYLFAFLVFLFCSCTPKPGTVVTAHPPQPRASAFTMHGDTAFTPAERADITSAATEWAKFSEGRVKIDVVFDLNFDDEDSVDRVIDAPLLVRAESWMSFVQREKSNTLAWTNSKRQIVLIVDRMPSFKPVVMHEMGHAAGLHWPDWCPQDARGEADCDHSPDMNSIMSAAYRGVQSFTEADKAFCRASGYCP